MSSITGQISWVYTHELGVSVAFWRDALGLRVVRDAGTAMIFETAQGAMIGVCEAFEGRVVEPTGSMITLLVDDRAAVDGWFERLREQVEIRAAPEILERFGIYSFFCADPNGYVVEVQCFLN